MSISMKKKVHDANLAQNSILAVLKPDDTVYTVLRRVSRSGMQRTIDMVVFKDGSPRWIGYAAAQLLGDRWDAKKRDGVIVHGCGMDMGFDLVYRLSTTLFNDGTKLKRVWL